MISNFKLDFAPPHASFPSLLPPFTHTRVYKSTHSQNPPLISVTERRERERVLHSLWGQRSRANGPRKRGGVAWLRGSARHAGSHAHRLGNAAGFTVMDGGNKRPSLVHGESSDSQTSLRLLISPSFPLLIPHFRAPSSQRGMSLSAAAHCATKNNM